MKSTVVVASGFFNPLHVGHLDYLEGCLNYGERLFVIVNPDRQVELKGSVPFMNERDRLRIVNALDCVSLAFLSVDEDGTVCRTLEAIHRKIPVSHFCNGGDRTAPDPREDEVCRRLGIEQVFGVGGGKVTSSSALLSQALQVMKSQV